MEIRDVLAKLEKLVGPYTMQKPDILLVSQEEYQLLYACVVDNAEVLVHNLTLNGQLRYRGVLVFPVQEFQMSNPLETTGWDDLPEPDTVLVIGSEHTLHEFPIK